MRLAFSSALASISGARMESFYFFERLGVELLVFQNLDDVKPYWVLTRSETVPAGCEKCGLLKLWNGLALHNPAKDHRPFPWSRDLQSISWPVRRTLRPSWPVLIRPRSFFLISSDFGVGLTDGQQQNVLRVDAIGPLDTAEHPADI